MTSNSETDEERAEITDLYNAWFIDRMGIRRPLHPLDAFSAGYLAGQEASYQRSVDEYEVQIAGLVATNTRFGAALERIERMLAPLATGTGDDIDQAGKIAWQALNPDTVAPATPSEEHR